MNQSNIEIRKILQQEEVLRLMIQQINKDLQLFALSDYTLDPNLNLEDFLSTFSYIIGQLINVEKASFFQFIYRIDIAERKLEIALNSDQENRLDLIMWMILNREYFKITYRLNGNSG